LTDTLQDETTSDYQYADMQISTQLLVASVGHRLVTINISKLHA